MSLYDRALAAGLTLGLLWMALPQREACGQKGDVARLLQSGADLAAQGRLAEAEVPLEQAHTLAPEDVHVLTTLAKVKARLGEIPAATELFDRVVAIAPQSADAHLDLALALADAGKLDAALEQLDRTVELTPRSALGHLNRARVLLDIHRYEEADKAFATAARLAPANPDCFFYWALLDKERSDFVNESTHLRALVKLQPRNEQAWVLLGASLSYQRKQSEAIDAWRHALAVNPNSSQALYRLSRALRATDPEEARKLDNRFAAARQNSQSLEQVKSIGNQGFLAMQAERWGRAAELFRQAISLCDDCDVSAGLHKDLGLALCHEGQYAEGRVELQAALRLDPNDPDIVRALAVIEHR